MENKDYQFVDLGLSVKWATCNIGANVPEEYGDIFSWGDVEPKASYTDDSCRTHERAVYRGGKISPYKRGIDEICTDAEYDAARACWGGSWHMPTKVHMEELVNKYDFEVNYLNTSTLSNIPKIRKVNPDNNSSIKYLGLIFVLQYLHFPPKST